MECIILKTHKKCANAKSKAKLSAAEKRLIDERQDQDVGGTQPQEESRLGVPGGKGKRIIISAKNDREKRDEDEDEDEEELEEDEDEESDVGSDSSASYTPRIQAVQKAQAEKTTVNVSKVVATQSNLAGKSKKSEDQMLAVELTMRKAAEERARKAKAAEWVANLPPRVDHPDARGEEMYDEADLEALRFEKKLDDGIRSRQKQRANGFPEIR